MKKMILTTAALAAALTFTGCTQNEENLALAGAGVAAVAVAADAYNKDGSHRGEYTHYGQSYGSNRNYNYRDGVRDGCDSRRGSWRQDNYRYNHADYRNGWEAGYKRCR